MNQKILWPQISASLPRTMGEMLYDAAAGLAQISQNKLDFYVDATGYAPDAFGPVTSIRYNCYIRVVGKSYLHLLFQVTTSSGSPFPAEIGTPEGEHYPAVVGETDLETAVGEILQRPRTREVIEYLLRIATV